MNSRLYYTLILLTLAQILCYLDRNIISVLIEPIKAELHLSDAYMGFVTGLGFTLIYSIAGLPIARLADRTSRSRVIAAGLTVWSLATAMGAAAQSGLQLLLARIAVGLGEGAGVAPMQALVVDVFPKALRAWGLGVLSVSLWLGTGLGLLIGGWASHSLGWRGALLLAGGPGLILALFIIFTIKEPRPARQPGQALDSELGAALRFIAGQRTILVGLIGTVFAGGGFMVFLVWTPALLSRMHHLTPVEIGDIFGPLTFIVGSAGSLASGWIASKLAARDVRWYSVVLSVACLVTAATFLAFLFSSDKTALVVYYGLFMGAGACIQGPYIALLQTVTHAQLRSFTSAINTAMTSVGAGLAPYLVGLISDSLATHVGPELALRDAMLISVAALVIGAVCFAMTAFFIRADTVHAEETS